MENLGIEIDIGLVHTSSVLLKGLCGAINVKRENRNGE